MGPEPQIPWALKLIFSAFVAVLVPVYWRAYSPWNFLFFCDIALLLTVAALWLESPLLASLAAVGIVLPQLLWIADFATGARITGMTSYMYDRKLPLFLRGLSTFHGWLPLLLLWLVAVLGYDRRAFVGWTVLATLVLLVSYTLAPAPPAPAGNPNLAVNLNYVHGLSYERPQAWMPPLAWLALLMIALPLLLFLPTHLALARLFPPPRTAVAPSSPGSPSPGSPTAQ